MANEYIRIYVESDAEVPAAEGTAERGTEPMDQLLKTIAHATGQISHARSEPHADKGFVAVPKKEWEALKAAPERWTALQTNATASGFRFVERD